MAFNKKKKIDNIEKKEERPLYSMTNEDRKRRTTELENARLDTVYDIEQIMAEAATLTGKKFLKRRKKKLGKAPNDWVKK